MVFNLGGAALMGSLMSGVEGHGLLWALDIDLYILVLWLGECCWRRLLFILSNLFWEHCKCIDSLHVCKRSNVWVFIWELWVKAVEAEAENNFIFRREALQKTPGCICEHLVILKFNFVQNHGNLITPIYPGWLFLLILSVHWISAFFVVVWSCAISPKPMWLQRMMTLPKCVKVYAKQDIEPTMQTRTRKSFSK